MTSDEKPLVEERDFLSDVMLLRGTTKHKCTHRAHTHNFRLAGFAPAHDQYGWPVRTCDIFQSALKYNDWCSLKHPNMQLGVLLNPRHVEITSREGRGVDLHYVDIMKNA